MTKFDLELIRQVTSKSSSIEDTFTRRPKPVKTKLGEEESTPTISSTPTEAVITESSDKKESFSVPKNRHSSPNFVPRPRLATAKASWGGAKSGGFKSGGGPKKYGKKPERNALKAKRTKTYKKAQH